MVFEAESPLKMLIQHIHTEPVPPSVRLGQPVPSSLEAVILSCLKKDPASRPGSAEELSELLAGCDVGDPWTPAMAREWWGQHMNEADQFRV